MSSGQFTEKKMYRSMSSVYSKLPGTSKLAVVGGVVCQFHPGSKASDDLAAGHSRLTVVQAGVLRTWVFTFETRSGSRACAAQLLPRRQGSFLWLPMCNGGFISIKDAANFSAGT